MNRWMQVVLSMLLGAALCASPAPAAMAQNPPPPKTLTAGIDANPGYQPQTTCSPSAKPGAKALLAALITTWGGSSYGISRPCSVGGTSEHKEGRALDWHMDVKSASDRARVDEALAWITANNGEVAYRLGIQYVIWNQRLWGIYDQADGWRPMADRGSYTANHKNHVHISLTWDGAMQQTSWWTGRVVTVPLTGPCGVGAAPACLPTIARAEASTWPYQQTQVGTFRANQSYFPAILGVRRYPNTLTATAGSWAPDGAKLSYQWLRNDVEIPDAKARTHVLAAADIDATLTVRVTATAGGATSALTSFGTDILPGAFTTVEPVISGSAWTDGVLAVDPGAWSPAPTALAYQWRRDGRAIAGATDPTYTVRAADVGHKLSVAVTGSAPGYADTERRSAQVRPVRAVLTRVPVPWVEGVVVTGGVVRAVPGDWEPAPVSLSYRWYRNGKAIKGATRVAYRLVSADRGKRVTVRVTGKRAGYVTVSAVSAPAGTPLPTPGDPQAAPTSPVGPSAEPTPAVP